MWAIIFPGSRHQLIQNVVNSLLCLPLLINCRRALRQFSKLDRKARETYQSNDFFVMWVFISQLIQFVHAFFYNFSFTEYIVWFILGLVFYAISNFLVNFVKVSPQVATALGFVLRLTLLMDAVILFWSLVKIQSKNNCGQINADVFQWYLVFVGGFVLALCVMNFVQICKDDGALNEQLISPTLDSFEEGDLLTRHRSNQTVILYLWKVVGVIFLNCFAYAAFLAFKFPTPDEICVAVFENLSSFWIILLAVLEFGEGDFLLASEASGDGGGARCKGCDAARVDVSTREHEHHVAAAHGRGQLL